VSSEAEPPETQTFSFAISYDQSSESWEMAEHPELPTEVQPEKGQELSPEVI